MRGFGGLSEVTGIGGRGGKGGNFKLSAGDSFLWIESGVSFRLSENHSHFQ